VNLVVRIVITGLLSTGSYLFLAHKIFHKPSSNHSLVFSSHNNTQFKRREENQLDAIERFIALIICSTCFRHLYAHHQALDTILVLLLHIVCNALVPGGRLLGAQQQAVRPG